MKADPAWKTDARRLALAIDPMCVCNKEQEPGKIAFMVVRGRGGRKLGYHRTAIGAWHAAYLALKRGK